MTGQRDWFSRSARCARVGLCAALLLAVSCHSAFASLVINLRFNDTGTGGTSTMDISGLSPSNTVVIQVWATVTGANSTTTDDGMNSSFFGVTSSGATANLTGAISTGSVVSPFSFAAADGGQPGTLADRNADGIGDWRGTAGTNQAGWAKAGHGTSQVMSGGSDGHQNVSNANAWDFHIADAVFTIGSITLPGSGTLNALTYNADVLGNLGLSNSGKANWFEDGVSKSATATLPAAGSGVTFTLTGAAALNDSAITYAGGPVNLGNYLLNGARPPVGAQLNKTGTQPTTYSATPSNNGLTVGATGAFNNGPQTEIIALSLSGNPNGNQTYGPKSYTVTVDNLASDSAGPGQGSADPNEIINVSANVGLATTAGTALGAPLFGNVSAGGSYAGLASKTTAGIESGAKVLGTEATMLGGNNAPGGSAETVQMSWRARRNNEKNNGEGGLPLSPPLPPGVRTLISDVVDVSGLSYQGAPPLDPTRSDPYVLQMSYDQTLLGGGGAGEDYAAFRGRIYLGWLNPDGAGPGVARWENAINGDFAVNVGVTNFQGSWAAAGSPLAVGSWGVDTANNVVWAVIDHNSEFAVVPEPTSIVLLGVGAVGLLVGIRRRRR